MKNKIKFLLWLLLSFATTSFAENENIHVYDPVPGLAASEQYAFRVREVGSTTWLEPFAFITRGKDGTSTKYYDQLKDWSNTYINFEMSNSVPVEIEISKVDGTPITRAVPHPAHKVKSCEVAGGKAYVVIDDPALFTVDIDGQMDDQNTSRISPEGWGADSFYSGPPIHTLTVFANPFLRNKPATNDSDVFLVEPGVVPAHAGSWKTLYFLPGVHDIGRSFLVHKDKNYYIPGDAIVHGTFNNEKDWNDGNTIRIFGHGTLSGERIPHPDDDSPPASGSENWRYKPIDIVGARDTTVEGITITDSAMHSIMLVNSYQPDRPTDIRWVKIFTWRGNGDGVNPFGNGLIEDCFFRTADDCTYVNGRGIRRCVFWTDVNGSAFTLSPIGGIANPDLVVEDCDIIYNRSRFTESAEGGGVFNMRGAGDGEGGSNVTFRDIRVSDPRPTRPCFAIQTASSYTESPDYDAIRGDGDIVGIRFENISIAAPSILGYPETLWGNTNAWIRDCIFQNVTLAGVPFTQIDDFNHNEYVTNLVFIAQGPKTNVFLNTTGDGLWDTAANWDVGEVPTSIDLAKHDAVDDTLIINKPSAAESLFLRSGTATVSVVEGGSLVLSMTKWNPLRIGDGSGGGIVNLSGGTIHTPGVQMDWNESDDDVSMLNLNSGLLRIEGGYLAALRMDDDAVMNFDQGVLRWKGNRIANFTDLVDGGYIQWSGGRTDMPTENWDASWTNSTGILFADFNDVSNGYTTVWAFHDPSIPDEPELLNVLFIAIDDLNDWIGPLGGHPQARTPHLDSFARSAVTFSRAYCPSTVCGPSRSAVLTGKHATNTGVYGNKTNLKDAPLAMNLETLPEYFGNRGYYTLSTGKIFHKHATSTSIDDGRWAFHETAYTDPTWGMSWEKTLPGHSEYRWGAWSAPTEDTLDFVKSRWAAEQLERDFGGKPFFMALGFSKPHLPFHAPEEFFDLYPLADVISAEFSRSDYDDIVKPNGDPAFSTPPGGGVRGHRDE